MGAEDNLTQSQKNSAYFSQDSGYDPLVYENTTENWFKILGMLILFYIFQALHWWANFELGINNAAMELKPHMEFVVNYFPLCGVHK